MKLGLSKYSESAKPKKHVSCHSGLCPIISEFSKIEIPPLPTANKSFLFTDPSLCPLTLPKPIPPPPTTPLLEFLFLPMTPSSHIQSLHHHGLHPPSLSSSHYHALFFQLSNLLFFLSLLPSPPLPLKLITGFLQSH